jgi:hypothetical protein
MLMIPSNSADSPPISINQPTHPNDIGGDRGRVVWRIVISYNVVIKATDNSTANAIEVTEQRHQSYTQRCYKPQTTVLSELSKPEATHSSTIKATHNIDQSYGQWCY